MPQLLTEGIVDALIAYFRANLPAKVAALNAAYGDTVKLEAPNNERGYFVGERDITDGRANYPAVLIYGSDMRVMRYGQTYTDAEHDLEIVVALRAGETEKLQRSMYRYARAIWELIVERFFGLVDRSDYFTVSEPRVEYERPPSMEASGPYIAKMHMFVSFNKQEATT